MNKQILYDAEKGIPVNFSQTGIDVTKHVKTGQTTHFAVKMPNGEIYGRVVEDLVNITGVKKILLHVSGDPSMGCVECE